MSRIIDGKAISAAVKARIQSEVSALKARGISVGLAVIIVGENPASKIYVANKKKACEALGIVSEEYALPESTTEQELLELINTLNNKKSINGILCQLPLPPHLDEKLIIKAGLINDEFGFEYFTGHGYAAVMFEGESSDPEKVSAEIKAEIERIKTDGIDKKLFSAVRCGMYGDAVRSFNSVESITMNLVNCAMFDCGLFDELKYLKNITAEDVLKRLQLLDADKSVLSVIEPTEEQR